jgi:cell fate regulator YaaT (PSP1 superfamily)
VAIILADLSREDFFDFFRDAAASVPRRPEILSGKRREQRRSRGGALRNVNAASRMYEYRRGI